MCLLDFNKQCIYNLHLLEMEHEIYTMFDNESFEGFRYVMNFDSTQFSTICQQSRIITNVLQICLYSDRIVFTTSNEQDSLSFVYKEMQVIHVCSSNADLDVSQEDNAAACNNLDSNRGVCEISSVNHMSEAHDKDSAANQLLPKISDNCDKVISDNCSDSENSESITATSSTFHSSSITLFAKLYSLKYLSSISKSRMVAKTVKFYFGTDIPLKCEYVIDNVGTLSFFLAPKFDEDDMY